MFITSQHFVYPTPKTICFGIGWIFPCWYFGYFLQQFVPEKLFSTLLEKCPTFNQPVFFL